MVFTWFSAGRLHNQLDTLIEGQEDMKASLMGILKEISTTLQEIDDKLGSKSPLAP